MSRTNFVHPSRSDLDFPAQALIEFAITLPLMLFIIFGLIEIGRIMQSWILIENDVRAGASYAANNDINPEYCPVGECEESERYEAQVRSIQDVIWDASAGIPRVRVEEGTADLDNAFRSLICLRQDLVVSTSPAAGYQCYTEGVQDWEGEYVVILIEYNHSLLVPLFFIEDSFLRLKARRDVYIRVRSDSPFSE